MKKSIFEGSEKKLEVIFSPTMEPLRNKPESFWKKLCKKSNANIVSCFSNSFCDSYVLSESSLFVWDHRLLILTCGNTSLVDSILVLLKSFKKADIELMFYQRKNEFFPYIQKTSFMQDFEKIQKKIQGKAYRFGVPEERHFYLFHSEGQCRPDQSDRTIEILMYDLDDHIKKLFFTNDSSVDIKNHLGLGHFFENAEVDDYIFNPVGYSLNGLVGKNQYYTIHVTPQEPGFYISFETNVIEQSVNDTIERVISLFKPLSFDVIVFSSDSGGAKTYKTDSFTQSSHFFRRLECGYQVNFSSFSTLYKSPRMALEL